MNDSGFVVSRQKRSGFTLVELLVVVSIIGLLAGISIPIVSSMISKARLTQARNTAHQLKNAISSYVTDYRKFPVRATNGTSGDTQLISDHTLMDVLLAADKEAELQGLNQRKTVYFSGSQGRSMGNGRYKGGVILSNGGAGELWDPFGEKYRVILDTDSNGRIPAPDWLENSGEELSLSVAVWSAGKDRDDSAATDNQKSW